jgi:hypothetical protein
MQAIPILNLNTNPATFKDGEAKDARNIVLTKDLKAIRNENGFTPLYATIGRIIGKVEVPNGFVLFSASPDEITYILNDNVVKKISSNYLKFSNDCPIDGNYTFNSDGDLIIEFSEGVQGTNETRIVNINKSSNILSKLQADRLDIIPNIIYPTFSTYGYEGGSILSGTYQFSIAYKVDNSIYSNYSILSPTVHIVGNNTEHTKIGDIVNRHLVFSITNVDTRYEKFKIGILYKGADAFEKCFETEDINTNVAEYKIYNTNKLIEISIDDLTIPSVSYIKDETSTVFSGRMYRGNVQTIDYVGLDATMQNIANNVKVTLTSSAIINTLISNSFGIVNKHFKEGEYYALYIGAFDYKGNFVNAYPIPCKTGDSTIPVNASVNNTFKVHKIPYNTATGKSLYILKCTLPTNIDALLGTKFSNTITSFCYLYAKHDFYNSKILAQGVTITDYVTNDFEDNQRYEDAFESRSKLRFYSLEHLYLKSRITNTALGRSKIFPKLEVSDYYNGDGNIVASNRAILIYGDNILEDLGVTDISSASYVRNNNTADGNIAGESHYKLNISQSDGEALFGAHWTDVMPGDAVLGVHDLISKSNDFYHDLYTQNLVMASCIVSKYNTQPMTLYGDFFYDNFTFRITAPKLQYRYGTEDIDLQGEDYVYKFIVSINIESRFNLAARYSGTNYNQKVFNIKNKSDLEVKDFFKIPYTYDNFINTDEGKGYDLNCHYPGYDYNVYERELDTKFKFINRVIRSVVDSTESRGIPWRIFKANDYIDLSLNRGCIFAIQSDERTIYIQQEFSLSIAAIRDKLSNSNEGEAYIGSSDVFDRDPYEVLFDKTGYIGCNNRFSSIITPFGYLVVDPSKQNIFLVKGTTPKRLNDENSEEWFNLNIKADSLNPYNGNGITLLYDDEVKSLFFTQISSNPFTIQYTFPRNGWLCFHDYIPSMYINGRTSSYCITSNIVYKRYAANKGRYFTANYFKSYVTFIYNIEPDTYKQIMGLMFNTRVTNNNNLFYDKTFQQILIYNDTQCTGYLDVAKTSDWFDVEHSVYVRDSWFINNILDIVKNDKLPFMNEDGSLISSNLNSESDWFTKSYFISKYCFVKFVYDNLPVDNVDLDIIFNSYSINAVKSLR